MVGFMAPTVVNSSHFRITSSPHLRVASRKDRRRFETGPAPVVLPFRGSGSMFYRFCRRVDPNGREGPALAAETSFIRKPMPSATVRPALLALTLLLLPPSPLLGQSTPVLTWQGEIRPRTESREPVNGERDHLTSMRARIGLLARMEETLSLFFQVQDVRIWGEEASARDRSADALDFHQAYLEVDELPGIGGRIRAGRQEVDIGESRLMGAPNWGQAGQTFDGARWFRPREGGVVEATYLQIRENSSPSHEANEAFMAVSYAFSLGDGDDGEVYLVHDRDTESAPTRQISVAGIWKKTMGLVDLRLQGIYQTGERSGIDVEAYLLAASGTLNVLDGRGTLTLWYDRLSGDDDPDDGVVESFSTLFGARNRYYGRADYFLDIPRDTGGLGLQDAALKLAWLPSSNLSLNVDLHSFRTEAEGGLDSMRLGEEVDTWARYRVREYLTLQAGASVVWAGPVMEALQRLEETGSFLYFMSSLKF